MNLRDIDITTVIIVASVLNVFPIQLLLCFKVKTLFLRLTPSLVLVTAFASFFILMKVATDWSAIGYAILFVFAGVMLALDGFAWGLWALITLIKKKRIKRQYEGQENEN